MIDASPRLEVADIKVTIPPPTTLPSRLARRLGAAPPLPGEEPASPRTPLGWALHWAGRGICVVPCHSWLGKPIPKAWYKAATTCTGQIVDWWSETPDADIGAVPNSSGYFVIAACGRVGRESLELLEQEHGELEPFLRTETRWGDIHLWFKGKAISSRDYLGPKLHVMGPGTLVFMPPSLAPDRDTDCN